MTEGRQPFTAEIKTLAKGPSTYDPFENTIRRHLPAVSRKLRPFVGPDGSIRPVHSTPTYEYQFVFALILVRIEAGQS
jgi:hypothetical protein